jgi:branched-chain amino acid transport system substrate-binding protein
MGGAQMKKATRVFALVLTFVLLAACANNATPETDTNTDSATETAVDTETATTDTDTIKIGVLACITGANSEGGRQYQLGAKLAEKYINEKLGGFQSFGGKKVELVIVDTTSDPNNAVMSIERALEANPDIVAFSGVGVSAMVLAALPAYDKYQIASICGTATNTGITQQGSKFIFQPGADGTQFGAAQVEFMKYYAELKGIDPADLKIGIVFEDSAYGRDTSASNKKMCEDAGLTVLVEESYNPVGFSDASPIVTKLKNAGVDLLLPTCFVNDAKLIVDTMAAMDYKPLMIGGGGAFVYTSFVKDLGDQANGILSVTSWGWDNALYMANPEYKDVIEPMFRADNNEFMAEQVGPSFICTMMIYEAIEETKSTDRIVIRDYIKTMTGENSPWFALYHPNSKFDENGKNIGNVAAIVQWQDNELRVVYPIDAASRPLVDAFTLEPLN